MNATSTEERPQGEFRRGWPVVVAASLGIGLGLSPIPFYTIGVFIRPLSAEFGWAVDEILASLTIMTFATLIMAPIIGVLADRFGVRRVALVSVVLFSISFATFALGEGSLVQFYLTWAFMAAAGAGTLPVTWTRAVNAWFDKGKGLALGLSLLGTGLFGPIAKLLAEYLIETGGWRLAYIGVALLPLLISFPIAFLFFRDVDDPKVRHKSPVGLANGPLPALGGMEFGRALTDWRFYLLAVAFVPISFAVGGPIPNIETMLQDKGFDRQTAVGFAALIGPSVIFGRLVGGFLIDRFWAPLVGFVMLSLPAVAFFILAHEGLSTETTAISVFLIGFAAGIEYDLMAYFVARYFGMRAYGKIYGTLYGFFALGAGIGPYIFGRVFRETGTYDGILYVSAGLLVAASVMLLFLGRYRKFEGGGHGP